MVEVGSWALSMTVMAFWRNATAGVLPTSLPLRTSDKIFQDGTKGLTSFNRIFGMLSVEYVGPPADLKLDFDGGGGDRGGRRRQRGESRTSVA